MGRGSGGTWGGTGAGGHHRGQTLASSSAASRLGAVTEHLTRGTQAGGQKVDPLWRMMRMRTGSPRAWRGGAAGVLAALRAPPDLPLHARDIGVSMHPPFQRVLPSVDGGLVAGEFPSSVMEPVGNYPCSKHVHPPLEPWSPVRGSWGQWVS